MAFKFDVVTLFPEMFDAITKFGIGSRALQQKYMLCSFGIRVITPRITIKLLMTGLTVVALAW